MQELFVWVPITDGVIAGGRTKLIPSHTFEFEGFPDAAVADVRFNDHGPDQPDATLQMSEGGTQEFAAELGELLRRGTIHSPYDLRRYPHLGFLRFLNHNPYADSARVHIILIPQ